VFHGFGGYPFPYTIVLSYKAYLESHINAPMSMP